MAIIPKPQHLEDSQLHSQFSEQYPLTETRYTGGSRAKFPRRLLNNHSCYPAGFRHFKLISRNSYNISRLYVDSDEVEGFVIENFLKARSDYDTELLNNQERSLSVHPFIDYIDELANEDSKQSIAEDQGGPSSENVNLEKDEKGDAVAPKDCMDSDEQKKDGIEAEIEAENEGVNLVAIQGSKSSIDQPVVQKNLNVNIEKSNLVVEGADNNKVRLAAKANSEGTRIESVKFRRIPKNKRKRDSMSGQSEFSNKEDGQVTDDYEERRALKKRKLNRHNKK